MKSTTEEANSLGEKIVGVLKTIFDPEIPVDIYELGLIYDVFINEDNDVKILMTLTSPNCPVAETLPVEVEEKVKSLDEIKDVQVEITFDPPWTQDLISEEAKLELGMLQFMSSEIKNRVSESSIKTIDLEKFYPKGNREFVDIAHS